MKTQKRRRKEAKTNYKKRLGFLKSKTPRIVLRKTNKYLIAQYITSKEAQDSVVFGIDSRKLLKYGWPESLRGGLKGISAAYLLGMLVGKRIVKDKLETPIADFGLYRVIPKTKLHSFVSGLIDVGVKMKDKPENFPEKERKEGKHIKNLKFEDVKSKIGKE
jgi:large subunit ribosomal protein L18